MMFQSRAAVGVKGRYNLAIIIFRSDASCPDQNPPEDLLQDFRHSFSLNFCSYK